MAKRISRLKAHKAGKAHKTFHKPAHKLIHKRFNAKKFCPSCGKEIDHGMFCKDCKKADFDFKDITITLCNSCHSYNHKNKWTRFKDLNKAVSAVAKEHIKAKVSISRLDNNVAEGILESKAGVKKDIKLNVVHKKEEFEIPARIEVTLCTKCSKMGTQYFESVLQLRNANKQVQEFVFHDIAKQSIKGIHLNKVSRVDKYSDENMDLFLTSKNYATVLAEKVRKNFGGHIKKNAKLFSIDWETSKNQYRLNVLLELPLYGKDDVIKSGNDLMKIISIGSKIHVLNLKTKAKTSLPCKDYDVLKPAIFQVIKKYPEYEVLDPNTYYQARLMNPSDDLEINQKIRCVIDGAEAWMV
jgi:NMD protein affecting ribosome stability and mRNA decay